MNTLSLALRPQSIRHSGVMTDPNTHSDFASAAIMRLVVDGLARQGITAPIDSPEGARIPRPQKRDILAAVLSEHGPKAILSISDAAQHMSPEPVVQALTHARSLAELLDRWQRLERFSHAKHTVAVTKLRPDAFRLTHKSRHGGSPPSAAESLLVLGLIGCLSEIIGARDVTLRTKNGALMRKKRAWHQLQLTDFDGTVELTASQKLSEAATADKSTAPDLLLDLRNRFVADPVRRWSLKNLADDSGLSVRTLQRRLTAHSMSFSRILSEARLEVAARHLCDADGPSLAEIGFLSGFSDQAHFARAFSKGVGTTPSAYRRDFQI